MSRPGDPVDAGFARVADLTASGDLAAARDALADLVGVAGTAGRPGDAAGAARLAATLSRVLGEPDRAARFARQALDLAIGDDPAAVALPAYREAVEATLAGAGPAPDVARTDAIRSAAAATGDGALLAEVELVIAAGRLAAGDPVGARERLAAARRHALDAVAPEQYLAAVLGESAVADRQGDDAGAYAALATGYATLADLVGRPAAATVFTPRLRALRERWGADRFAAVKAAYELRSATGR